MIIPKVTAVCEDCKGKTLIQAEAKVSPADHFLNFRPTAVIDGFNLLAGMGLHHNCLKGDNDKDEPQHAMFSLFLGDYVEGENNKSLGRVRTSSEVMLGCIAFEIKDRGVITRLTEEYLAGRGKEYL